jgi:hypothetical protein
VPYCTVRFHGLLARCRAGIIKSNRIAIEFSRNMLYTKANTAP